MRTVLGTNNRRRPVRALWTAGNIKAWEPHRFRTADLATRDVALAGRLAAINRKIWRRKLKSS